MNDPIVVEVRDTVEELPEKRFENSKGEVGSSCRVMVDNLLRAMNNRLIAVSLGFS